MIQEITATEILNINYKKKEGCYDINITNDISQVQYNNFQDKSIQVNFIFSPDFRNEKVDLNISSLTECKKIELIFDFTEINCSARITDACIVLYKVLKTLYRKMDKITVKPFEFEGEQVEEIICRKSDTISQISTNRTTIYHRFIFKRKLFELIDRIGYNICHLLHICIVNKLDFVACVIVIITMKIFYLRQDDCDS